MIAESTVVTDEITSFAEEHEYDVVVVGAGTTGVPAAISAYQGGASVAVLQKQGMIIAQGHLCAKVVKEKSTEIGMRQYIHYNHKLYDYRNNPKLWERYVDRSEEAVNWFLSELDQIGFDAYQESDSKDHVYEDGNCYLEGGVIYAIGSGGAEVAVDANTEKGYKLYVNGGTLFALGGLEKGSSLSQSCYQASSWNRNTWYSLSVGNNTFAFKTPSSGGTGLVVSGSSEPEVKSGVTVTGGDQIFNGMGAVGASFSGGSTVSLSAYSGGTSGPGGGGPRGW